MATTIKEKNIRFSPDGGLMYLIQTVTGQTTSEILGFFFDFGKKVLEEGIENMTGRSIRKDIRDYYPNTAIPFKMLVESSKWGSNKADSGSVYVSFPDNPTYINTDEMMSIIVESQLLGTCALPKFEQPKSRTPKMYKDLINEVLRGNNGTTVCDSGHTRETGSADEAVAGSKAKPRLGSKKR